MSKIFEGRAVNANIPEAIRQAVTAASKEHGPGGLLGIWYLLMEVTVLFRLKSVSK